LHFRSKEEVFLAAMQKYLDDGLVLVQQELSRPGVSLFDRLMGAMDAWFGRHFATFTPGSFDVVEAGDRVSGAQIEDYKRTLRAKFAKALAESSEFKRSGNVCTPREVSQVLFLCGLTWKQTHASRVDFMKTIGVCIRACCQLEG